MFDFACLCFVPARNLDHDSMAFHNKVYTNFAPHMEKTVPLLIYYAKQCTCAYQLRSQRSSNNRNNEIITAVMID